MIVLTDNIRVIQPYDGKSKYDFWNDMQKGDVLIISMHLKPVGHYKPMLTVKNERTSKTFEDAINSLQNYLQKMTYEEVVCRSVSNDVKKKLVRWLSDEYDPFEARQMIEEANISEYDGRIEVTYNNGVRDVVRIENGEVIQI